MYYSHLYHHGIKGQKWGVRRFQNADGSLTNAGRSRYLDGDGSLTKRGAKLIRKAHDKRYMDEAGNLTKKGTKAAKKDSAFSIAVKQASFERKATNGWTKAYNQSADEFESILHDVHEKFKRTKPNSPERKALMREAGKKWKDIYSKNLIRDIGKEPISNGTDWIEHAPFMNDVWSTINIKES